MFSTAFVTLLQLAAVVALPTEPRHQRVSGSAAHAERAATPNPHPLPLVCYNSHINDTAYVSLSSKIPSILQRAIEISTHSWELGTLTEALLEVYNPSLAPFNYNHAILNAAAATKSNVTNIQTAPIEVIRVAAKALEHYDFSGAPAPGTTKVLNAYLTPHPPTAIHARALIDGAGSLGDPCALGPATWVLAHFADAVGDVGTELQSDDAYAWAVANQLAYLNNGIKSDNGTISMREGHFELWADQGYMIPPYLAYLGLTTKNTDLLSQALHQWSLTSSGLLDTSTNLYRHVNGWDARPWATGNAWMLAGLMRVLGSIESAGITTLDAQVKEAQQTAAAVFKALFDRLDESGRLPNYMDQHDPNLTHGDSAGTAGVVSAYYRFLVMRPDLAAPMKDKAAHAFASVVAKINADSWLTQVVDPQGTNGFLVYPNQNTRSPEGQSLVAAMWAARTAAGQ